MPSNKRTDRELKDAMKDMVIVTDTREQQNHHILAYLDSQKVKHTERALHSGDYTAEWNGLSFENDFVVERKHGLDELCGNITSQRDRFEREFTRCKANGTKVYLVIENASWDDVFLQNYRSKLSSKSLLATLFSWQTRFNVTIIFCDTRNAPKIIHGILYYAVREWLMFGYGR